MFNNPQAGVIVSSQHTKSAVSSQYRPHVLWLEAHHQLNDITDMLLATAALPVIMGAHVINGTRYFDGGIVANDPAFLMHMHAELLHPCNICVSVGTGDVPLPSNMPRSFRGSAELLYHFAANVVQESQPDPHEILIRRGTHDHWRINPKLAVYCRAHDHELLPRVEDETMVWIRKHEVLFERVSRRLVPLLGAGERQRVAVKDEERKWSWQKSWAWLREKLFVTAS
eukprot:TRINITY_DN3842_c0_g1_i1.p1 TRINITY_DN3842_c0_g1~~TRINITY_DN3842_c0_g1_i1.p1  ORF type:complete len:227 (+),score=30.45 TRINITY_DN3842_c0_g1_i1:376-1056(+)